METYSNTCTSIGPRIILFVQLVHVQYIIPVILSDGYSIATCSYV